MAERNAGSGTTRDEEGTAEEESSDWMKDTLDRTYVRTCDLPI